jgi:hypothetical protein
MLRVCPFGGRLSTGSLPNQTISFYGSSTVSSRDGREVYNLMGQNGRRFGCGEQDETCQADDASHDQRP